MSLNRNALDLGPSFDHAQRFFTPFLFDSSCFFIHNYGLYAKLEGRYELINPVLKGNHWFQVFETLPSAVCGVLRGKRPSVAILDVLELYWDGDGASATSVPLDFMAPVTWNKSGLYSNTPV